MFSILSTNTKQPVISHPPPTSHPTPLLTPSYPSISSFISSHRVYPPCRQRESSPFAPLLCTGTQDHHDHDSLSGIDGSRGYHNADGYRRPCVHSLPALPSALHGSHVQRLVSYCLYLKTVTIVDACGRNQLKLLPDVVMSDECRDCKSATTRELSQGADFRCQQNMQLLCRLCVPFSAGKWHGELLFLQK